MMLQDQDIIASIEQEIRSDKETAEQVRILYGGSVTPRNAPSFLKKAAIDGLLVGHESLLPGHFVKIANCAP